MKRRTVNGKTYYGEEAEPVGFDAAARLAAMSDADILACEVEAPDHISAPRIIPDYLHLVR